MGIIHDYNEIHPPANPLGVRARDISEGELQDFLAYLKEAYAEFEQVRGLVDANEHFTLDMFFQQTEQAYWADAPDAIAYFERDLTGTFNGMNLDEWTDHCDGDARQRLQDILVALQREADGDQATHALAVTYQDSRIGEDTLRQGHDAKTTVRFMDEHQALRARAEAVIALLRIGNHPQNWRNADATLREAHTEMLEILSAHEALLRRINDEQPDQEDQDAE